MSEPSPSHDELYQVAKTELLSQEPPLNVYEGDISDLLVLGAAAMADHIVGWTERRIAATYLDGAKSDDLTQLCDDHFGITRNDAQRAYGALNWTRATAAAGAGTIAAGSVIATVLDALGQSIELVTMSDLTWGAAEVGTKAVDIQAIFPGRAGNLAATRVTRIVTALWDSTFTISNPAAIVGGEEVESDDSLKQRTREFLSTVRRGTIAALEFGAKTVAGVTKATAQETATKIVNLYVTDSTGGSNPSMITAVETEMPNWRAAGTVLNVIGGTVSNPTVAVTLITQLGVDANVLRPKIKAALEVWSERYKISDGTDQSYLYRQAIGDAVKAVDPDGIVNVNVTLPASDQAVPEGTLIRILSTDVTVNGS